MNVIMLTGRVKTTPELKQSLSGVQHAHFVLEVSHRTAGGRTKREDYPVQAWHNRGNNLHPVRGR